MMHIRNMNIFQGKPLKGRDVKTQQPQPLYRVKLYPLALAKGDEDICMESRKGL